MNHSNTFATLLLNPISFSTVETHSIPQIPESSWNSMGVDLPCLQLPWFPGHQLLQLDCHFFQVAQVSLAAWMAGEVVKGQMPSAAARRSSTCMARPSDACRAMWQCMSQEPGLSVLKAMMTKPLRGRSTTSRRGGLSSFRLTLRGS